jgi:Flp pilus assembly protein TadG
LPGEPSERHVMTSWKFRERNRQKGATLVEAALVFPILILIVIAILELGMLFRDYLTVSYLSREGARIGALAGDDSEADCAILMGIENLASSNILSRMSHPVHIFRANSDGTLAEGPNVANRNPVLSPQCTVPADPDDSWTLTTVWIPQGCTNPITASCRQTSVGTGVRPDILGVRLRVTHNWITGFPPFRGSVQIDETTITRLEPKAFLTGP